jgi:thioredoxin reductase
VSGTRKIIIVGGGPAGVAAAMAAKQQDAAAEVVLLNDEHHEPYEKPPLSKAVLTGKLAPHDTPIAGPKGIAATGVALKGGTRVAAIDRAARMIVTDAGERVGYDALVLTTGSINRVLPMFPAGRAGVYYLRTEAEARALKDHLHRSQSLVVIGGGLIGLEVAASAAELGVKTTVVEVAPRILARVCDEETSAIIAQAHRARGVDIRVGTTPSALRDAPDGRLAVETTSGDTLAADLIVVGIGAAPDDRLAAAAGLTTMAARQIRRSSRPETARAFPDRTDRCGWRTGAMRRSTARSPAAMPPAETPSTTSRRRSGPSNTTCTSRAWAGRSHNRARACAGRSGQAAPSCSSSTERSSSMPRASTRSATSHWRGGCWSAGYHSMPASSPMRASRWQRC